MLDCTEGNCERSRARGTTILNNTTQQYQIHPSFEEKPAMGNPLSIEGEEFERCPEFKYLSSPITEENSEREIKTISAAGNRCYYGLQEDFRSGRVSRSTKLYEVMVRPDVRYVSEIRTSVAKD